MGGLATITASSTNGWSHPVYSDNLPEALAGAGFEERNWPALLAECNQTVRYQYGLMGVACLLGVVPGICCCMCSETLQQSRMAKMCVKLNAGGTLPANVRVDYKCTESRPHFPPGGGLLTIDTYHNLTFSLRA